MGNSMGFTILNNVEIQVIDKENKQIIKKVKTHNKATRTMVSGILRFVEGLFTSTNCNDTPQYSGDVSKNFIPCYFNVGDGGVILDENNLPESIGSDDLQRVPNLIETWNETVDYTSKNLVREFTAIGQRTKIRKQLDTLSNTSPTGDMDSIYFLCEIAPSRLNAQYANNAVFVTEIGLFANNIPNKNDLLAYVKLGNYYDEETSEIKTNALYVRPRDTIVVKWVISVAAIGKDNILRAVIDDENGDPVVSNIEQIPSTGSIEIIDLD